MNIWLGLVCILCFICLALGIVINYLREVYQKLFELNCNLRDLRFELAEQKENHNVKK